MSSQVDESADPVTESELIQALRRGVERRPAFTVVSDVVLSEDPLTFKVTMLDGSIIAGPRDEINAVIRLRKLVAICHALNRQHQLFTAAVFDHFCSS
jgi:hypothetical protein